MSRTIAKPFPRWQRCLPRTTLVLVSMTLLACGFSTAPGPPYDFARLERVAAPILTLPGVTVVDRQQTGTDCHGMSCGRPRLTYTLRTQPPASFETVQQILRTFDGVTEAFAEEVLPQDGDPAAPHRWAYVGEVGRHAVEVWGELTSGGDSFAPGAGTVDVIHVVVWADRLAVP